MIARRIDRRTIPNVAGIDLEQALNYIDLDDVGLDFIYNSYTHSTLPYRPGARPALEQIALPIAARHAPTDQTGILADLAAWVATTVRWAGFYHHDRGQRLPSDRALREEELVQTGYGWCNEQARLFCALCQCLGFPARLVFGSDTAASGGHVTSEVLLENGWLLIDQSLPFLFLSDTGTPVNAWTAWHDPHCCVYFRPRYDAACARLVDILGREIMATEFRMCLFNSPFDGFAKLGFCNHFLR